MNHVGIDLHKMECQICIHTTDDAMIEQRVATRRDRLQAALEPYRPARVVLEASTESEWVASHLESCGHEVVVADPNFAPMYAHRSPRIKTDRRDARMLADACRAGTYRPAHRRSATQRRVQAQLAVRDTLVRSRSRSIAVVRAMLRRDGWRLRSGGPDSFVRRVDELGLPTATLDLLAPVLALIGLATEQIRAVSSVMAAAARGPVYDRLQTAPSVGPITALAYVAALDQVTRFGDARQVRSYLGLVPSERSSGEIQRRGRITKQGNQRTRWLLVEAAWRLMRTRQPQAQALQAWAARIAKRRGRKIAAVALARRLAGILYALWRDDADFQASPPRPRSKTAA